MANALANRCCVCRSAVRGMWHGLAAGLVFALGGVMANGHVVTLILNSSATVPGEESAKSGGDEFLREHGRHRWRAVTAVFGDPSSVRCGETVVDSANRSHSMSGHVPSRPPSGFRLPLRC